ncbi:MAG: phosphoribosylformylglycinamidine synthase subunit PurQ [Alphaproteobacteria bacterium]|nr:phosphoribosylformylglycinamidine synthase subunit PurQ [Alphaproteobacteria bacterium]
MKAAVIVFPGSNCDRDIAVALGQSIGSAPTMIWHRDTELPPADLIVVPGGFSYGDYLRAGAMAAHSPIMREVVARARAGTAVLAICNGFQVATECGLLPGVLLRNSNLKFVCRDVHLRVENPFTPFTQQYDDGEVVTFPVAHHDGNYFADAETHRSLLDNDQIAFRYCDRRGGLDTSANPNGSLDNIAGIFNANKNVLGLMPHPERASDPALGGNDGRPMFESLVASLS